jgi:hypothetical protein
MGLDEMMRNRLQTTKRQDGGVIKRENPPKCKFNLGILGCANTWYMLSVEQHILALPFPLVHIYLPHIIVHSIHMAVLLVRCGIQKRRTFTIGNWIFLLLLSHLLIYFLNLQFIFLPSIHSSDIYSFLVTFYCTTTNISKWENCWIPRRDGKWESFSSANLSIGNFLIKEREIVQFWNICKNEQKFDKQTDKKVFSNWKNHTQLISSNEDFIIHPLKLSLLSLQSKTIICYHLQWRAPTIIKKGGAIKVKNVSQYE